jgi:hypothetical protein
MKSFGAQRRVKRYVEAGEHIKHHQHGHTRTIWRTLADLVISVASADGLSDFGLLRPCR